MGVYVNETALLCVSPRIPGDPEDYSRETVKVSVAMNGQDFAAVDSHAHVTFVGTGSDLTLWKWIITFILVALLLLGLFMCGTAAIHSLTMPDLALPKLEQNPSLMPKVVALREGGSYAGRGWVRGSADVAGVSPNPYGASQQQRSNQLIV